MIEKGVLSWQHKPSANFELHHESTPKNINCFHDKRNPSQLSVRQLYINDLQQGEQLVEEQGSCSNAHLYKYHFPSQVESGKENHSKQDNFPSFLKVASLAFLLNV